MHKFNLLFLLLLLGLQPFLSRKSYLFSYLFSNSTIAVVPLKISSNYDAIWLQSIWNFYDIIINIGYSIKGQFN